MIGIASRNHSLAFIVPRKTKRHFNEYFRRLGQPRKCAPSLFAASIVVALQISKWIPSSIVIDAEYEGQEDFISSFIVSYFPESIIRIERIGRSSPAHEAAYTTHRGRREPDGIITRSALEDLFK